MAEIGTILAVIQIADRVIELSRYWIEGVRDAESELRTILLETSMLKSVLENIGFLSGCSDALSVTLNGLSLSNGPLDHCQRTLSDLLALIPSKVVDSGQRSLSNKERMKIMVVKLSWPAKRSKAEKLLDELQRYKAAISLALITESVQDIKDIKAKTNQVFEALTDTQRHEFCSWLQQTDPSPLHNRARSQFVEGTCEWILRMPEWDQWLNKKHRCLWIHGIPGAGKTILASYLIEELEHHCERNNTSSEYYESSSEYDDSSSVHDDIHLGGQSNCISLYYYCYFAHAQNEAAPMLRWLITQLCRAAESIPSYIYRLYKKGHEPSLPDLLTALTACLESFETVYVVVDAVDESKPRDDLLKVLRDLVTDFRFSKIQILATSREYIDIERVLEGISQSVSMSNPFITEDIHTYVKSAIQNNPTFQRWPRELVTEVESALSARAQGMFRWAVCQVDRLGRLRGNTAAVRHALATLPRTLEETYERIFADIPDEERQILRLCLGWIDFHNSLYAMSIPCAILLQAISSTMCDDLHHLDIEDLRELCGCLINISLSSPFEINGYQELDSEFQTVSFAHYTVREFLSVDGMSPANPVAYFALGDQLRLEVLKAAMATTLKFNNTCLENDLTAAGLEKRATRYALSEYGTVKEILLGHLTTDLGSYCALSSIVSFSQSAMLTAILSQPGLVDAVIGFLDPSTSHIQPTIRFLGECFSTLPVWGHAMARGNHRAIVASRAVQWQPDTCSDSISKDIMWLFAILVLCASDTIWTEFIKRTGRTPKVLAETTARFSSLLSARGEYFEFHGSLTEVFAQESYFIGSEIFEFLMDIPGVPSSTSHATAILHAISSSIGFGKIIDVSKAEERAYVLRLLEHGADPDGRGYATTPLQQAVAVCSDHLVELLVAAGADVNALGDPHGTVRRYSSELKDLEDKSPLFICYHDPSIGDDWENEERYRKLKIAKILVQYGARALRRENGEILEGIDTKRKRVLEILDDSDNSGWPLSSSENESSETESGGSQDFEDHNSHRGDEE